MKKIKFLITFLALFCISVNSEEFQGCYKYDLSNLEFLTPASHLDPSIMTPKMCSRACDSIGYALSTIISSSFCFCKKDFPVTSEKVIDSLCFANGKCTYDDSQNCGYDSYMLVYLGDITWSINFDTVPNQIQLFQSVEYNYEASSPGKYLKLKSNDKALGDYSYVNYTGKANISFTTIGKITIDGQISSLPANDSNNKKLSFSSPIVQDQVSNFSINCPNQGSTDEYYSCELTFDKGSNTSINIDYKDGTTDNFALPDSRLYSFGIQVPQSILINTATLAGSNLLLYNTLFQTDGYIRAVELYAISQGQIRLEILALTSCYNSYSTLKDPNVCGDFKTSSTFSCSSSAFLKTQEYCSNENFGTNLIGKQYSDFTIVNSETINLNAGYNLIKPFGGYFRVKQGWFLGLTQITALIAIDESGSAKISDYSAANTPIINNYVKRRFYVRAFINKEILSASFHSYLNSGKYDLKATITNPVVGLSSNSTFIIYEKISGLTVSPYNAQCQVGSPCNFLASTITGSHIIYNWTTPTGLISQNQNSIQHIFTATGNFQIDLIAYNPISNNSFSVYITVLNLVSSPSLFAYNQFTSQSASIVNKNAQFVFTIKSGSGYSCLINYGDGTIQSFNDLITNPNNTIFNHIYIKDGEFSVLITCENLFSKDNYTFKHTTQYEILDLKLLANGALRNTPFIIQFSISSGSNPSFEFYFNNILDTGIKFDSNTKSGVSSFITAKSSGIFYVNLTASNLISRVSLSQQFEVGATIREPKFNLLTTGFKDNNFYFGTKLDFTVNMLDGANVRLRFYFGEETDPSIPSTDVTIPGDWNNEYKISYTHIDPGDYTIYVNVSNAFQSAILTQKVSIVTNVENLIPGLAESPVVFSATGSTAYFKFSYYGNTKSGSHATVNFWPGDLFNVSFGPYLIGMNFKLNSTTNSLMYKYQTIGTYTPVFLVQNMLGSKWYSFTFEIREGVTGLYINFPQVVSAGSSFQIETYLVQGLNAQYEWTFDGFTKTSPRLATSVSIPDYQNFNTTTAKNATLLVKASDPYSAVSLKYLIEIQNPVLDVLLNTIPSDIENIANDGTVTSRTIVFIVNTTGDPTNPYLTIDYGDGRPIASPIYFSNRPTTFTYTYSSSGLYNVVLNISNKISYRVLNKTVKILSDFAVFNCNPYWRPIPIDGTEEIAYTLGPNNVYSINRERELRLNCSWANAFAETFIVDINNMLATYDMNSLKLVRSDPYYSCIIPYPLSILNSIRNSAIIPLKVTYSNSKYTRNFQINIRLYSAVILNGVVQNNSVIRPNNIHPFVINYITLAEPSCAIITFSKTNYQSIPYTVGTSSSVCSFFYPGIRFDSVYKANNSVWELASLMSFEGSVKMSATVRNENSSQTISTTVTVTNQSCAPPLLFIANRAEYFYNPIKIPRTKMITFLGETTLRCNESLSNIKRWNLFKINPINGAIISNISLTNNPTANFAELVIEANYLSYGLYKFVYSVEMVTSTVDKQFKSEIENFVKIVPTGIVVFGLKGGIAEMRLGIKQELSLVPASYSFDLDSIVSINSLKFKFYCTVVDAGVSNGYPKKNLLEKLDLFTLKSENYPMSNNNTCFENSAGFVFDPTGNVLTIKTSALNYYKQRTYKFMIETTYLDEDYFQEIDLILEFVEQLPIITLGCNPLRMCNPYPTYQKINPNSQLMITGTCTAGCDNVDSISYSYQIYRKLSKPTIDDAWIPFWMPYNTYNSSTRNTNGILSLNDTYVLGSNTNQIILFESLFRLDLTSIMWKIDLSVTIISKSGINSGSSSLVLSKNELPFNGSCTVSPNNGTSLSTKFKIICSGWIDTDGKIVRYEYYATYLNNDQKIGLGYNPEGQIEFELQQGPAYDQNRMYLYVDIIDDDSGITRYNIMSPVIVKENSAILNNLISSILSNNPLAPANIKLFSGNSQAVIQVVNSITSMLNNQGFSDKNSQSNKAIVGFGPYQGLPSNVNFDTLNNIKVSSNYSGVTPSLIDNSTFEENRLIRSKVRDSLFQQLNNISISDESSMKMWAGVLSTSSQASDEISRQSAAIVSNQCLKLAQSLNKIGSSASLDSIKQISSGLLGAMSNVITGLTSSINGYSNDLKTDLKDAQKPETDNDLENFWNNPNNFETDATIKSKSDGEKVNNFKQKFQLADSVNQVESVLKITTDLVSTRLNPNQSVQINTPSMSVEISKFVSTDIPSVLYQGISKLQLPNFCDLTASSPQSPNSSNPFYKPPVDPNACNSKTVVLRTRSEPAAPAGLNGLNETKIEDSNTMGLDIYDENSKQIPITNSKKLIDIWVPRNPSIGTASFQLVNITDLKLNTSSFFLPNGIKVNAFNISVFIHLMPYSNDIGYFVWSKLGYTPIINSTYQNFDKMKIFCPNNTIQVRGEKYYQMFINNTEMNGFKGFVGIGLREMNQEEYKIYCLDANQTNIKPLAKQMVNFTSNFGLRIFTSGCYFYDLSTSKWLSDGVEVLEDTNFYYTHCRSKHLTQFAGGFIVLPPSINFENVFANASFAQNPTIYITVIVITVLYVLSALLARYLDYKDSKKIGINLLPDNNPASDYCYEIIVFTGSRNESATDSLVRFILSGEFSDTGVRCLSDPRRKIFRRAGVDSFILAVDKYLGPLQYLRIWHDNSGIGDYASWFLKFVIIRDLQTKEKFYFLCENWLAVEKSDGQIDRLLPLATEVQKTNIQYLAQKEAKEKLRDSHLWLSIISRPVQSSFTRLDRVTCCFVLLYATMLMNILYYGIDKSSGTGLEIGPFMLTQTQIVIGIITNLIIFPPTFFLIYLFRKSKPKTTHLGKLNKSLDKTQNNEIKFDDLNTKKTSDNKLLKKNKGLPWWCKIIAYVISFICMIVSLFFVIIQGINLGDEKVKKWLTSFFISIFTSIFLTQPIKIVLTTLFLILICRKSNDQVDIQHDADEDDASFEKKKNLNKDERLSKYRTFINENNVGRLNNQELNQARQKREREILFWKMLKEVLSYMLFISVLFIFSYSNRNPDCFKYKTQLEKLFIDDNFQQIHKVEDIWSWSINYLSPKLRISQWYNKQYVTRMGGFLPDFSSRMIGYGTLRSNRVQKDSCKVPNQMNNLTQYCDSDYNLFNEEKGKYSYNWDEYNSNHTPIVGFERIYKAFQYIKSDDLDGLPYAGVYNTYGGGGYVYELRGKLEFLQGNLSLLQQNNWIDRQTRSVFVEFTVFNPNINLFSISTILFEVFPSGNVVKSYRFEVMNLITDLKSDALTIASGVIYLAIIAYFMVREIFKIFKLKKLYFKQFWSYIQWLLIAFSWACLAMFIYRVITGEKVKSFFAKTAGYGYIKLQAISYWNEMLTMTLAFCTCLATLKFIKLLRFNSNLIVLITAIRTSLSELIGISFILLICFLAFIQTFYVLFNEKIMAFSTVFKSATTCFQILLGKFEVGPILKENYILGPLVFAAYNLAILMIIISIFISVVSEKFIEVKNNKEKYLIQTDMTKFLKQNVIGFFYRIGLFKNKFKNYENIDHKPNVSYSRGTDLLSSRMNVLLNRVNDFNKENLAYKKYLVDDDNATDFQSITPNGLEKNLTEYDMRLHERAFVHRSKTNLSPSKEDQKLD